MYVDEAILTGSAETRGKLTAECLNIGITMLLMSASLEHRGCGEQQYSDVTYVSSQCLASSLYGLTSASHPQ